MNTLLKIQYRWRFRERGLKTLCNEFKLAKHEIKILDNELKEAWVKAGKSRVVGGWLLLCSLGVFSMITLGGYVRLTKSGLSMIKWDLHKILPPMNKEEWEKEFNLYKDHPQFKNDNPNMKLDEFKRIYLLEFYHRQLGKGLGIVFVFPFLYFTIRGYLKRRLWYTLSVLLGIGSMQGFIGWWMVKSGLNQTLGKDYKKKDVKVAPYRLAIHFTTAVILFGVLFNQGLFLVRKHPGIRRSFSEYAVLKASRHAFYGALFWNFITLISGSLMAGNDAGKIINTFPKMGDIWIPNHLHFTDSKEFNYFKDLLENQFIVHFNHRAIATFNISVVLLNFYKLLSYGIVSSNVGKAYLTLTLLTVFQYCMGIVNVFTGCKTQYALTHQSLGITTFAAAVFGMVYTRKLNLKQTEILFKKLITKDRVLLEKKLQTFKNESPNYYRIFFEKPVTNLNINV